MTDADAQAASLRDSPEPQAYLSEVTLTDDVHVCQEVVVPRTYAQAVDPSNEFHKEWRFAEERELNLSRIIAPGILFLCLLKNVLLAVYGSLK